MPEETGRSGDIADETRGRAASQLGKLVRDQRLAAGLTQLELAVTAGIGIGVVRDLEQGITSQPRTASVQRLVAALSIDNAGGSEPRGRDSRSATSDAQSGTEADSLPAPLQVLLLGPLEARRNGEPVALGSPRQQAILGLLALRADTPTSREVILGVLWSGTPPPTAVTMIQSSVGRLRRLLVSRAEPQSASGPLVRAGTGYALRMGPGQLDSVMFGDLCAEARTIGEAGDHAAACALYERALSLWRGEPLAGIDILGGHPAVAALIRDRAAAVTDHAAFAAKLGRYDRGLPHLHALAAEDPLNERVHAQLMVALAGTGQQAAALDVFERTRRRLADQLGISPSAELREAHERVLRQEVPGPILFRS